MNNIFKKLTVAAIVAPLFLTSCVEDTFPTSGVTSEQVSQNSKGVEAILSGMPAYMKKYHLWGSYSFNFGYPSLFIQMNVQTQDMINNPTGYDWFSFWSEVSTNLNSNMLMSQTNWYYLNFQVRAANDVITAMEGAETSYAMGALAQAYLYRASTYLDMARIYEFLPNETISPITSAGNDVTGLTVPVNTPEMTAEQLSNNPRLPHKDMVTFLLNDIQTAIDLYDAGGEAPSSKVYPSKAVAYGLMARVHLWDENYPEASKYAKMAIDQAGATPLTKEEWLSTTDGFNNSSVSSWLWSIEYEQEDDPVNTSDCWTSFMSPETPFGYGGQYAAYMCIDKSLYDRISNADFRKLAFKAPEGHPLSGREPWLNASKAAEYEPYTSIKFRPAGGNLTTRKVAYATAIPLMRIEEMYFIQAEAEAHNSPSTGKQLIESFMQTYRYQSYTCPFSDVDGVVDEIILQKRMEFWGENTSFFDFKRLDMDVIRAYPGTNWPDTQRFNTNGRPGWMNWPFVDYEGEFNLGVRGYLNPNVGDQWTPITDESQE
ncbi:MAG: RagB/SusD family nutrient uptake outer membrane protein [Paramuribaculum sp.]|nr:RagB/SusD family nutrient uptake outer membrane protein [Paramuribaculum sp.]